VAGLRPGGPAETAGIAVGDIVVRVHEHPVTTLSELRAAIGHHQPGDMLGVDLIRGDERLRLVIRLGAREDD
jgi:S1-C subfamily serine protease